MFLADKKCVPCEVKIPPLDEPAIKKYLTELRLQWKVGALSSPARGEVVPTESEPEGRELKISHQFKFKDFKEAMAFVNKVADLAEREGHHPDIHIFYNKVTIELWTHFIGGLHENDFILASKIELLI